MEKMHILMRRIAHRPTRSSNGAGFSMLEAVVVVGVLLALAVGGLFSYGPITEKAKKAKTESVASQVYTAVMVSMIDGDSTTDPQDTVDAYNASQNEIRVEIRQGANTAAMSTGDYAPQSDDDFCIRAITIKNESIFSEIGNCVAESEPIAEESQPAPTESATPTESTTPAPEAPAPAPVSNGFSTLTMTAQAGSPTAENGNGTYYDIASNGDGSTLIATSDRGRIFKSTDSGVTWNYMAEHAVGSWQGAALSADGQHITVSYWDYTVWQSNNGGSTWGSKISTGGWRDVAMSANGQHQIVALDNWHNYYSHNHGASWTLSTSGPAKWKSVDVSDNGQIMVAAADDFNQIKISKDGGANWAVTGPTFAGNYAGVSMSSDGQVILAGQGGASNGTVTVSTDGGATWKTETTIAPDYYRGTAMSADGSKMIVVGKNSGNVYTSVDSGATWQKQETGIAGAQWYAATMSEDGKKVAFTSINNQKIHTGVWQ